MLLLLYRQEGHNGPGSLTWENFNQMLNVAIYITKIWPCELLFYYYPTNRIRKNINNIWQVALEMIFSFLLSPIGTKNVKFDEICFKSAEDMTTTVSF